MIKRNMAFFASMTFLAHALFPTGMPVFDASNFMQAMESVWQGYQEIQAQIENVKNTYEQIQMSVQNMKTVGSSLKEAGSNFIENMNGIDASNPFSAVGSLIETSHYTANDVTRAVDAEMSKWDDVVNSLNSEMVSVGGTSYSLAELCGAGDKEKNILGFAKNATEAAAEKCEEAAAGWAGKLTLEERIAVMKKYGMSPEHYAKTALLNIQMQEWVDKTKLKVSEKEEEITLTTTTTEAAVTGNLEKELRNIGADQSTIAQLQILGSKANKFNENLEDLCRNVGDICGAIATDFQNKQLEQMEQAKKEYAEQEEKKALYAGPGIIDDDF